MREVIPEFLWISNALEARDVRRILAHGIHVLIDLAIEEPPIQLPRALVYCRFPLADGAGNSQVLLRSAIETSAHFVAAKRPTLIACGGGTSRSPVVAAAALAKAHSLDVEAAVQRVASTGPCDLSPKLLTAVLKACER